MIVIIGLYWGFDKVIGIYWGCNKVILGYNGVIIGILGLYWVWVRRTPNPVIVV